MGVTGPEEWSVACEGGCRWERLPTFDNEFDALEAHDPVSHDFLDELMKQASGTGLGIEDYDAPIGRMLTRIKRPWLGELKANGPTDRSGRYDQHRLYFGEAPLGERSLVACLLGSKPAKTPRPIWLHKQNRHIGMAMDRLMSWCRRGKATYRILDR